MNNFNILGRLSKDPDLRTSAGGKQFCYLSVAVPRDQEHTDFIDVTCFGNTAKFAADYFSKGKHIAITGHIDCSSYDKNGERVYMQKLVADRLYFAGFSKNETAVPQDAQSDFMTSHAVPLDGKHPFEI